MENQFRNSQVINIEFEGFLKIFCSGSSAKLMLNSNLIKRNGANCVSCFTFNLLFSQYLAYTAIGSS